MALPASAEIVIIGGGAVGCGIAYALAMAGKTDVVLVERAGAVAQATTSQGAGLCGQVRSTVERTKLAMHSAAVFRALEAESDVKPQWRPTGSLRIAYSDAAVRQFQGLKRVADEAGVEAALIDNDEARRHLPAFDFAGVKAVLWVPTDGYMTPQSVARAYERQASLRGARFYMDTPVTGLVVRNDRLQAVDTAAGRIECRYAINAAGAHAYHVARLAGLNLPIIPVRHEYFVSVRAEGMSPQLPCFRVPDTALYGRADGDRLLLGGWERTSLSQDPRGYALAEKPAEVVPDTGLLADFAERLTPLYSLATRLDTSRIGRGWPTFTPDGAFIIGESSRVRGFVMAGGCNAHGISGSGGIGKLLVESLLATDPSPYVRSLSPDRFNEPWDWATATRAAQRVYETYYDVESC